MRTWSEEISSRWRLRGSLVKEMALRPNMENGRILAGEGSREEAGGIENGASTVNQGKAWGTASPLGIHEFLKTFEFGILACTASWDHDAIWKGDVLYVSLICVNCTPTDLVRKHIHLRFWEKKKKTQLHFILFFTLHQHICFSVRCSSDFRTGVALGSLSSHPRGEQLSYFSGFRASCAFAQVIL